MVFGNTKEEDAVEFCKSYIMNNFKIASSKEEIECPL